MVEVRVTARVSLRVDEAGVESGDEVNPSRSNHLSWKREHNSSGRVAGSCLRRWVDAPREDLRSMHHSESDLMRLTSGAVVSYGTLAVCVYSVSRHEMP